MSVVFLDTVGLLAQWDRIDPWHAAARRAYRGLVAQARKALGASGRLLTPRTED